MRTSKDTSNAQGSQSSKSTDTNRYPTLAKVLHAVSKSEELPKGDVTRIEISTQANGDAAARVWAVGAEEPEGIYLPAEE